MTGQCSPRRRGTWMRTLAAFGCTGPAAARVLVRRQWLRHVQQRDEGGRARVLDDDARRRVLRRLRRRGLFEDGGGAQGQGAGEARADLGRRAVYRHDEEDASGRKPRRRSVDVAAGAPTSGAAASSTSRPRRRKASRHRWNGADATHRCGLRDITFASVAGARRRRRPTVAPSMRGASGLPALADGNHDGTTTNAAPRRPAARSTSPVGGSRR
ncbi:hypothetical protein D2E22_0420 [Bifidobacterium castoris]|uniref:Uncharacterized protein n=1 Tax=Bifidobacterium castoris TaxID=2306972 RepID=A0A430FAT8_9BIFI|nr:hypothetical protein D2E22_0420 [Bifidobacterium castoris]